MNMNDFFKWKKDHPYDYLDSYIKFERTYKDELAEIKESLYRTYIGVVPVWEDDDNECG